MSTVIKKDTFTSELRCYSLNRLMWQEVEEWIKKSLT